MDELFEAIGGTSGESGAGSKRSANDPNVAQIPVTKKARSGELESEQNDLTFAQPNVVKVFIDENGEVPADRIAEKSNPLLKQCTHEVAFPPDTVPPASGDGIYHPVFPANPAKTWKFTLDPFQRVSVSCLERDESVLVSAHTSAGKTVVAEYAIAKAFKANQRVIYTSPIKALSNQKYRELKDQFGDVGLMTGDVTIDPNAQCIVMTTEILRSMLYRGSEVMREVAWVVFDEIHYMNDKERGVVWEETIVLLPHKVHYVFLSATVPNAAEFALWVSRLHGQPCHVVYTDYRPTPLQNYVFPSGGSGIHLVVDERHNFKEHKFQEALAELSASKAGAGRGGHGQQKRGMITDLQRLLKMIMERGFDPAIIFSFSRVECEQYASRVSSIDFNGDDEKSLVNEIFSSAVDSLPEDEKNLEQITSMLPLLRKGIGIHHSGLLPLLKEVVELLFQEGLIKVLFATETFAMGLNMPAKTVIFTRIRKFDGDQHRFLTSGEYTQMSGRAGRRGLDDRGIAILIVDDKLEPQQAKAMLMGQANPLLSAFRLSYNMILNTMRVEDAEPEYMIRNSFKQFQNRRQLPQYRADLKELEAECDATVVPMEKQMKAYHQLRVVLSKLRAKMHTYIVNPKHCLYFLQPGRLARIVSDNTDYGWGAVLNFKKHVPRTRQNVGAPPATYTVDMCVSCLSESLGDENPAPAELGSSGSELAVLRFKLDAVAEFSAVRVFLPRDIQRKSTGRQALSQSLRAVFERFPEGIPLIDPIQDMGIRDPALSETIKKIETLEAKLMNSPVHQDEQLDSKYAVFERKVELLKDIQRKKQLIKGCETMILESELKNMSRVLKRLGHISPEGVVLEKGRVACEIMAGDELLLTEIIFENVFEDMSPEEVAATMSFFVCEEGKKDQITLRPELQRIFDMATEAAKGVAKTVIDCGIKLDVGEYSRALNPALAEVTYSWAKGAQFASVCSMTKVMEGSIIRMLRREAELIRQLADAGKTIGSTMLEEKFNAALEKIKRSIVFTASLYL